MSPEELPSLDLPPEAAERIRRRGQRELRRWSRPSAQTWIGRLEREWIRWIEPSTVGVGAVALVLWAVGTVLLR